MCHETTAKSIVEAFFRSFFFLIFISMLAITLLGCKDSKSNKAPATPVISVASAPVVEHISSLKNDVDDLTSTITAFQETHKSNEANVVELNKILDQVKTLNELKLQNAIDAKVFSNANDQIQKLSDTLVANGSDKKSVDSFLKTALFATVVLGAIGAIGNTYATATRYKSLSKFDVAHSALYGSLFGAAAIFAAYALSKGDDVSHQTIQTAGFLIGAQAGINLSFTMRDLEMNNVPLARSVGRLIGIGGLLIIAVPMMSFNLAQSEYDVLFAKLNAFYAKMEHLESGVTVAHNGL